MQRPLKVVLKTKTLKTCVICLLHWNSYHGCFGDGPEAVDEDVTGDIDRRTWQKQIVIIHESRTGFLNTTDGIFT